MLWKSVDVLFDFLQPAEAGPCTQIPRCCAENKGEDSCFSLWRGRDVGGGGTNAQDATWSSAELLLLLHTSGFTSADGFLLWRLKTRWRCSCAFVSPPSALGFQGFRGDRRHRPGSLGLRQQVCCALRGGEGRSVTTAPACVYEKMLNDIKIEDRLRTDACSLDVMIGE